METNNNINDNSEILFSDINSKYSFLSNSYICDLTIDGKSYYHVEGYYHSEKFKDINTKAQKHLMNILSPLQVTKAVRSYPIPQEDLLNWRQTRSIETMKRAIVIKFLSNTDLYDKLLNTGNSKLIYNNATENYWGIGKDKSGENALGKILMGTRTFLNTIKVSVNT